jgi:hypothetical protein
MSYLQVEGISLMEKLNEQKMKLRTKLRHSGTHLVQLFRAYVRAVCEPKVDETPFSEQILVCKWFAVMSRHCEWPTDLCASDCARLHLLLCSKFESKEKEGASFGLTLLFLESLLFPSEVEIKPRAGKNEKRSSFRGKHLHYEMHLDWG